MKHLFLAVVLFAAFTSSEAQLLVPGTAQPNQRVHSAPPAIMRADNIITPGKPENFVQALNWVDVYTPEIQSFFYFSQTNNAANVVEYDQATNSIGIVRSQATFDQAGSLASSRLGVMRSAMPGTTWAYDSFEMPTSFIGIPSFVQIRSGSNPLAWPLFFLGSNYRSGDGQRQNYQSGVIREGNNISEIQLGEVPDVPAGYAWDNSPDPTNLGPTDISILADPENISVLGAARLNRSNSVQWGTYGLFNFSLPAGDFITHELPDQWLADKFFVDPAGGLGSTRNADVILDRDNDGNIYAAFNNQEPGVDTRTVQVSKSTDFGETWSSSFNSMPISLIETLKTALGNGIDVFLQYSQMPYQGSAFIVTGPDEYSYFFRALVGASIPGDPNNSFNIRGHLICEARYQGGVWTLDAITALNLGMQTGMEGLLLEYPSISLNSTRIAADSVLRVHMSPSSRGIEMAAAKTADGNAIVLKYVDQKDSSVIAINPPIALTVNQRQPDGSITAADATEPLDTLIQTDIFLMYRNLSETQWSAPNNITNDAAFNRLTYMPRVVPSLQQVPVVQVKSVSLNNISRTVPASVIGAMSDQFGTVQFAVVDATAVGVEDEERAYDFRINNIVPNPATNLADVTFTLDKGAIVSADLYDVLGNKVRSLITPAFVNEGSNGIAVDVNTLAPGQYYVSLNVGGNRITRSLVVTK